jgi:hypothetical protein
LHVSVLELFRDWVEEFLHFDSKLIHTLGPLLWRPGLLTLEYVRGRRTRYLRPFRLWFAISVTYFVLAALVPAGAATGNIQVGHGGKDGKAATAQTAAPGEARPPSWRESLEQHAHRFQAEDGPTIQRQIQGAMSDYGPQLSLALVPLFALFLKALFWRTPLGEHFVFSFHLQAFASFIAIAMLLLQCIPSLGGQGSVLPAVPFVLLLVYLPLALRRVSGQGWGRTLLKASALYFAYLLAWAGLQVSFVLLALMRA